MPGDLNRWERIRRLGEGGQGQVFLVRTPERVAARQQAKAQIRPCIRDIGGYEGRPSETVVQELLHAFQESTRPDNPSELGALKEFKISPEDKEEERRAIERLESEIRALEKVNHPAVLKLLYANSAERFIVTEYHSRGPLSENLNLYRGEVLAALSAFRTLVDGVVAIQSQNVIHRDIKPANIFVAESGDLVLGDFGIVFFDTGEEKRVTRTIGELVGSHWWMPPWAYTYDRIAMDKVNPSFDVYPLAKVLWSMISGRDGFMREEFERDDNNLEKIFPDDPLMRLANGLLATCVVREEKDCISSALNLRAKVDALIARVQKERRPYRPDGASTWPCHVCGKGNYQNGGLKHQVKGYRLGGPITVQEIILNVSICDHCGHAELFSQ